MKKTLTLLLAIFTFSASYSQYIHTVKADSVKLTNDSCNTELIIENSTRNVSGSFLYNKGNGRTEFRKVMTSFATNKYLIGLDTLDLTGLSAGSIWISSGTNIYNGNSGNIGIGTSSPTSKLHVVGVSKFSKGSSAAPGITLIENTQAGLTTGQSGTVADDALRIVANNLGATVQVQNGNSAGYSGVEYLNNSGSTKVFTGFNNSNGQEFRFNNIATGAYINFMIGSSTKLHIANSGSVGIGTTSPTTSSLLDISSTTLGFLPPRMTTTQKNAVSSPAEGLILHDNTTHKLNYYNGTAWTELSAASSSSGYFSASGTDIYNINTGKVGIGTSTPATKLQVVGGNISSPGSAYGSEKYGISAYADALSSTAIGGYSSAAAQSVAVGANSYASGQYSTAVGESAIAAGSSTSIGRGASANGGFFAGGYGTNASHTGSILLGTNLSSTANNQFIVGCGTAGYGTTEFVIGTGTSSGNANSYGGLRFRTTHGSGTNVNGADFKFVAGSGTGSANGGYISFSTTAPGTSGSTLNTEAERVRITPAGNVGIGLTAPTEKLHVNGNAKISGKINVGNVSEYTDNAAAITGGLSTGDVYRTGDLLKVVH